MLAFLAVTALLSGFLWSIPLQAEDPEVLIQRPVSGLPATQSQEPVGGQSRVPQTVSADLLRHPISQKTRGMLQRALDWMRSGKHQEAIHQLEETLAKDPASAAYVHSLLGFEYMKTDQFTAAVNCFEQAVSLVPHDAITQTNFGVSLAAIGDYKRAEEQARRAQDLAPGNPEIRRFLDAVATYNASIAQTH
jgi:Flp pilus assembly protein TadD